MATASRVRKWVAVEQPGPWGRDAPVDSRLDNLVARALLSMSQRHGFRVLLIRRPGWQGPGERRSVFIARSDPESGWIERLEVGDPAQLADIDFGALRSRTAPGVGGPGPGLLSLVCTNGRHDACCADRGRPVIRALADASVSDVWETTHVGGDRFAANVVCLPSGVYLGRVEADTAERLLAEVGDGVVPLGHYRGRSCFQPLVQAAEWHARLHLDERRIHALRVVGDEAVSDRERRVSFAVADTEVRLAVTVRRSRAEATQQLTCAAGNTGHPWRYELVRVEE